MQLYLLSSSYIILSNDVLNCFDNITKMEQGIINSCPGALHGSASSIFLTLINALMASKCNLSSKEQYPSNYESQIQDGETFDFIIVGAGSAGSVVANRLTENKNWKVLLLEAGTYPSPTSEIPSIAVDLQATDANWQYKYEPSKSVRYREHLSCPRGKGLGGSSLINYMLYLRGNRYDYDDWAKAGNEGWDFKSIFPLFKKLENDDKDEFGQGLKITKFNQTDPIMPYVINAYKQMGYNNEYNEKSPLGVTSGEYTISNGKRHSTAKAFLGGNVKDRSNLFVVLNAQVSKLLIDITTVKGVEVRLNNKLIKVYARNEVILSAGAVNSPQILMNSGIGPKAHLENLGIKVIKDLKVGENLQDHSVVYGLCFKVHKSAFHPIIEKDQLDAIYEYFLHGKGPIGTMGTHLYAFVNPKGNSKRPSIQIYHLFKPQTIPLHSPIQFVGELPKNFTDTMENVNAKSHIFELLLSLSYPKSRGKILLRSNDPFDDPLIFPNYLNNNEDVTDLIEGIRFVQKLLKSQFLKAYNPEFIKYYIDDCQKFEFDSNEYWDCIIRHFVRTNFHLVGSCKMGPSSDLDAVVDSRLKVHGIKGIRVVDASIMPTIVGVNTNGPSIVIGEKGSEMIKEDWMLKRTEL